MISPSAAASTGGPRGTMMSIARWTRPPERAALKVSCRSAGRPPATGIIRLANLIPLVVGAAEVFDDNRGEGAGNDFAAAAGERAGNDFIAHAAEFISAGEREDFADGGRDVDGDICGSRIFQAPNDDCEGGSPGVLSSLLTRRGLTASDVAAEGESLRSLSMSLTRRGLAAPDAGGADAGADSDETEDADEVTGGAFGGSCSAPGVNME